MAPKRSSIVFLLSLALVCALAAPGNAVRADSIGATTAALPALYTFAGRLMNGRAGELRGIYATDLFADGIVQQPAGDPAFVSAEPTTLTQFSGASQLGSTGLLAHNYLAGAQFSRMQAGQLIYLVYGDGRTRAYLVTEVRRYRAVQPNNAYSSFLSLESGEKLGASALFRRVYAHPGAVVLQTCIEADGISTWGRLFVIAEPLVRQRTWQPPCSLCM